MQLDTNPLKNQYPIVVRIAGLSGIGVIIITFLSFPRFLAEAGLEQVEQIIIENIDIPQTQQIDNIPPPARPSIPVPTDDEDIADDLTLDDLDFDDFAMVGKRLDLCDASLDSLWSKNTVKLVSQIIRKHKGDG